jgi:large subunit ribosomal protein L1
MGSKKNVSIAQTEVTYKIVDPESTASSTTPDSAPAASPAKPATSKKPTRSRSHKYIASRANVDKTRTYDAFSAIELIKRVSYTKFPATISADGVVTEIGDKFTVTFPHQTGKAVRVAIVDDDLLAQIGAGQLDFDILLTTPAYMPKLAKFARLLGPKGLMPNPKNETITTDPEKKKAELEGGKVIIKTEKKAPLIHVSLGKTTADTKELVENLAALTKACGERLIKLSLSATMSPGIKVDFKK